MDFVHNINAVVALVMGFSALVALVAGIVAVRAFVTKATVDALRNEMTVMRHDFDKMKIELAAVQSERDGLKRDVNHYSQRYVTVLEENRELRIRLDPEHK